MLNKSFKKFLPGISITLLRILYNKLLELRYFLRRSVKTHLYEGYPLKIYIADHVSKLWYDKNWQRNEIKFLKEGKLKKGAIVFNIGSHYGIVALIFSKIVGKKGRVVAVEMDKHHVKMLEKNKKNNNAYNLYVINAAISDQSRELFYAKDQIIYKFRKNGIKVKAMSMDELSRKFGFPDVIYVDVEGYECQVLAGALKTLEHYPDFLIEVHVNNGLEDFNGSVKKILSYFPRQRYKLFMAPAVDNCKFEPLNFKSHIIQNRFYLIAQSK